MSKVAIVVEFKIKPEHFAAYQQLIRTHAARSLKEDPGCRQFDVLVPEGQANALLLYEVYEDEASFQAHTKTPRMKEYQAATQDMLLERKLHKCGMLGA